MRFWDASALVAMAVREGRTSAMRALEVADPRLAIWWGSVVECFAALERRRRDGGLDDDGEARARRVFDALFTASSEVPPTQRVRDSALRVLRVHPLRAADALQLGAALAWAEGSPSGRQFVSLDDRLRAAAAREGFTVLP